ncbi:MAG: hypothetical protein Phog2KO_03900 [Phototrophicaceae bacterium]
MPNDDLDLLHNFIHDLKTPMSSAKSFIDLITVAGDLNADQKRFAHRALSNLEKMQVIINTLLEFARMENQVELDMVVCDVLEAIELVIDMNESFAQERQVTIEAKIDPNAQFVQADKYFLDHVLTNLISNAIKYNRVGGSVLITSKSEGEFVKVSVEDTGLGIPEDAIERIFERFYRVETKAHMSVDGSGIGLAMVKGVIERHGGEISVESVNGQGTTFHFTLLRANTLSPDYDREPTDGLEDNFQEARDTLDDSDSGDMPR